MFSSYFRTPRAVLVLIVVLFFGPAIDAQTSTFTYQGRLTDTSMPASGPYQMQFALYDAVTAGTQIGTTVENTAVAVSNGVFTVQLDYGAAAFPGAERYLEISVRRNSTDSYVALVPRQRVTSAPHAIRASNASTADNASNLGGTAASQYVQTNDSRLSDARNPLPNSGNYIQNTTTSQAASFNVGSNGTIGGNLSVMGSAGIGSGPIAPNRLTISESDSARTALFVTNTGTGSVVGTAIRARSVNAPGYGIGGSFAGGSYGVEGLADATNFFGFAYGVRGVATGSVGNRWGVYGSSVFSAPGNIGYGVYGEARGPAVTNYGVYGWATGATTNWAGYFGGNVRVDGGNVGIGIDPDGALTGSFPNTLTVSGTVRAGTNNANACDLQLADDICFFDEQNGGVSVRNFSGTAYAPVKASAFNIGSSITLKKNITPLKRSDFNSMLRQIVEVPLFTYRYKNESANAPVHTGLIAERSPASVLSADGKAVDLYDFISLNAGATKALTARVATLSSENESQQQQIDRQQKQLDEQKRMIVSLRKLVCQQNPQAEVCTQEK